MTMKEFKSNEEMIIGEAVIIDSEGEESLINEVETLSEGELSDLLNQLQELDSESEFSKEELDLEPEESEGEIASKDTSASKTARLMLKLVNGVRRKRGVPPLRLDARLTAAAQAHSNDMARRRRISHKGSDGSTATQRSRRQGYQGQAGENVASGQTSVKAVMVAWMRSPRHRRNILNRAYKDLGVGYAKNGRWYWTQVFGLR